MRFVFLHSVCARSHARRACRGASGGIGCRDSLVRFRTLCFQVRHSLQNLWDSYATKRPTGSLTGASDAARMREAHALKKPHTRKCLLSSLRAY
jgi:hypothetical protein